MKSTILLAALAAATSGCSTTHYSLRDVGDDRSEGNTYFQSGLKFRTREISDRKAALAYDRSVDGEPAFKLSLTNTAKAPFDFDPASVRCRIVREGTAEVVGALDPELRLLALQKRHDDLKMSGLEATASILNSTSGILAVATNDKATMDESDRRAREDEERDEKRAKERRSIEREMEVWRTQMVRRTTLGKDGSVAGDVVCPAGPEDYEKIVVFLPASGNSAIEFAFERYAID